MTQTPISNGLQLDGNGKIVSLIRSVDGYDVFPHFDKPPYWRGERCFTILTDDEALAVQTAAGFFGLDKNIISGVTA